MTDVLRLDITAAPARNDASAVGRALDGYNDAVVGPAGYRELAVFLRDDEGRIRGGLIGGTLWGWLHVHLLCVEGRLLAEAEREAMAWGCSAAFLTTFDFQAPPFYRSRGYMVTGELEGFPPGHTQLTLTKSLTSTEPG